MDLLYIPPKCSREKKLISLEIRKRVLPLGDMDPGEFKLLYDISKDGENSVIETNYGQMSFPISLYHPIDNKRKLSKSYVFDTYEYKLPPKNREKERYLDNLRLEDRQLCNCYLFNYYDPDRMFINNTNYKIDNKVFKTLIEMRAKRELFILYLEELGAGRKSLLEHRHMLQYKNTLLMKRFDKFTNDISKYIKNEYIVGSSILYTLDITQKLEDYEDADIDICIPCESFEKFDELVNNFIGRIVEDKKIEYTLNKIDRKNDKYSYQLIIADHRKIDIFRAPIGAIVGYHVPMVRGAFDGEKFIITPSMLMAIKTKTMNEYRWIKTGKSAYDILKKYQKRGYKIQLSQYECEVIEKLFNDSSFECLKDIKKEYHDGIYQKYTRFTNLDNIPSKTELKIYREDKSIFSYVLELQPGESYCILTSRGIFIKKSSCTNEYMATVYIENIKPDEYIEYFENFGVKKEVLYGKTSSVPDIILADPIIMNIGFIKPLFNVKKPDEQKLLIQKNDYSPYTVITTKDGKDSSITVDRISSSLLRDTKYQSGSIIKCGNRIVMKSRDIINKRGNRHYSLPIIEI
jgi:hypothetical protein